jgi:hypothetical protein
MAMRALFSNGTFSTGTWKKVEAASMDWDFGNGTYDALTTERTVNVSFSANGNQVGIFLPIRDNSVTTGKTLTIKLYEGANLRTTDTFNEGTGNWVEGAGKGHFLYFALTSYAVTTAASTWSYKISSSSGSGSQWARTTTASDWGYAVVLDADTSAPSNGDTLIVADSYTFTIDQAFTLAYDNTTNYRGFWCCDNSKMSCLTPAASYTVTAGCRIWFSPGESGLELGTSTVPIPYAQQLIFDFSHASVSFYFESSNAQFCGTTAVTTYCKVYGQEATNYFAKVASDAAALQKDIVLTADMSAYWSATDAVTYVGYDHSTTVTNPYGTISSISGTTLTVTSNLSYRLVAGGRVVNTTRGTQMGIKIINNSTTRNTFNFYSLGGVCDIIGVHMYYSSIGYMRIVNHSMVRTWRNIINTNPASMGERCYLQLVEDYATKNSSYRYIIDKFICLDNAVSVIAHISLNNVSYIDISNYFSTNNAQIPASTTASTTTGITWTDCVIQAGYVSSSYNDASLDLQGNAHTVTDCVFTGGQIGVYARCNASTFTNVTVERGYYGLYLGNGVGNTFTNCSFGKITPATSYDIYTETSGFVQATLKNCYIGTQGVSNTTTMLPSSYVQIDTYDRTSNDHRSYYPYGYMVSVGDGLSDTTVHTSGTGKFAIRFEPTSSTNNLEWEFDVPTGNIQSKTMTVAVWVKINSATYYAGTHQLPRLTINYDNGTTAYAQAASSTDWQQLFVTFTPITTYGQITVTLSGRTDATTTDSYIYWDDMNLSYPPNYALDLGGMDNWVNALPVTPPIAIPISSGSVANSVWEALRSSHTTTGTMGESVGFIRKVIGWLRGLL